MEHTGEKSVVILDNTSGLYFSAVGHFVLMFHVVRHGLFSNMSPYHLNCVVQSIIITFF